MCIRDRVISLYNELHRLTSCEADIALLEKANNLLDECTYLLKDPVSYTHLRAHETVLDLVCRLLLEKKTTHLYIPHPPIDIHYFIDI